MITDISGKLVIFLTSCIFAGFYCCVTVVLLLWYRHCSKKAFIQLKIKKKQRYNVNTSGLYTSAAYMCTIFLEITVVCFLCASHKPKFHRKKIIANFQGFNAVAH